MKRTRAASKSGFDNDPLLPENLPDTANKLRDLLAWSKGQFGCRLQSAGAAADLAQTRKLVETADASPTKLYLLRFDQFIITPFTGPGQFDLVQRDVDDVDIFENGNKVSGGESEITISTKDGFADGNTTGAWSSFSKIISSDKIYRVVFVPGNNGDGVYSLNISELKGGH